MEFDVEIIYVPLPQQKVKNWQKYMRLIWEMCGVDLTPALPENGKGASLEEHVDEVSQE